MDGKNKGWMEYSRIFVNIIFKQRMDGKDEGQGLG